MRGYLSPLCLVLLRYVHVTYHGIRGQQQQQPNLCVIEYLRFALHSESKASVDIVTPVETGMALLLFSDKHVNLQV